MMLNEAGKFLVGHGQKHSSPYVLLTVLGFAKACSGSHSVKVQHCEVQIPIHIAKMSSLLVCFTVCPPPKKLSLHQQVFLDAHCFCSMFNNYFVLVNFLL